MNIKELENKIQREYPNVKGISIVEENKVILESYYKEANKKDSYHVYSVTKSVVSILIGILIDQGKLSETTTVDTFFPECDPSITIKDLLTMSVKYNLNNSESDYIAYFSSEDKLKFTLDRVKGLCHTFQYTPIIGPDILSSLIYKLTNKSVLEFANEFLFKPLEIDRKNNIILKEIEDYKHFNENSYKGWVSIQDNLNSGAWGLCLTLSEMNKIGTLLLNDGVYNQRQIISKSYVQEMFKIQNSWEEMGLNYGLMIWVFKEGLSGMAMGDGNNIIFVDKKKNRIVSILGVYDQSKNDSMKLLKLLM